MTGVARADVPSDKERGDGSEPVRRPSHRAAEWAALEGHLAKALGCLEDGHYLILETRDAEPYYVQFAAGGSQGLRAEAVSNRWWRHYATPVSTADIASLAAATLTKAFDVARPACLVYKAFSRGGAEILLPELGLEHWRPSTAGQSLAERVDAIMRGYLGVEDLVYDQDGDIPFRHKEAMVFVGSRPGYEFVRVFSPFLRGVSRSYGLLGAINDINLETNTVRAFLWGPTVTVAVDIEDGPGLQALLTRACDGIAGLANEYGAKLQAQFGGATFFEDAPAESASTGTGFYL